MAEHLRLLSFALFVFLFLFTAECNPADPNVPHCIRNSRSCVRNEECCGGCCAEGKCVPYAESCIQGQNICSSHQCPSGQSCYLQQVQCVQAPCPPIPGCKSQDYDVDY